MDLWTCCLIGVVFCLQLTASVYSRQLQCYSCAPNQGEDCKEVKPDQMKVCASNHDICLATAVNVAGVERPVVTRDCASSKEEKIYLSPGADIQNCSTNSAGQRVTRKCACNRNGCNSLFMEAPPPQPPPSAASTFLPSAKFVVAMFSVFLLSLPVIF